MQSKVSVQKSVHRFIEGREAPSKDTGPEACHPQQHRQTGAGWRGVHFEARKGLDRALCPVPSRRAFNSILLNQFLPMLRAVEFFDEVSCARSRRRVCSDQAAILPRQVVRHAGRAPPAAPAPAAPTGVAAAAAAAAAGRQR